MKFSEAGLGFSASVTEVSIVKIVLKDSVEIELEIINMLYTDNKVTHPAIPQLDVKKFSSNGCSRNLAAM